jgi:hypothetical protein
LNPREFELYAPGGNGIYANLDENGEVTFAILARSDSPIRGTEMFNRMMSHYGSAAKSIHGVWIKGTSGQPSTNIDKVNELTAAGMALEQAVLHAWTVTRAKKLGFGRVSVLGTPAGTPGNYTKVEVLIEK